MKNFGDNATLFTLLACATRTADVNGAAVDIQQAVGEMLVVLSSSATDAAGKTLDVKLQDSADGSTGWADISGAAFTQVTDAAASTQKLSINADACARYIRAVGDVTGSTPSVSYGVAALAQTKVTPA